MFSIIIPVLNQHDMTVDCINTIRECTEGDYELIIIDNGSDPAINIPFTGFNEARIIRNEENKGFPVAINQGIRDARGEDIIIMNNDVIVTPDALNRLIKWLDEYSIVGPLTNYCAGMQSIEAPIYEDIYELHKIAMDIASENEDYCQEVNFIIGFCFAFKKKLFYEIGEFDESLWPCSGEEIDFCFRAREIGYKIGIAHDVYVHHIGSQTFKDMNESGKVDYEKVCERSDKHLAEKWGNDFWQKQNISVVREQIVKKGGIYLNLGCGYDKKDGYVNIDNRPEVEPDLICNVIDGLPYEDNSIDGIRAFDFLEHIPIGKTIQVITEIWRVLKLGAVFESFTPDAENGQGAFQDPYHVSYWVENSWLYFSDKEHRKLYNIKANFEIESIERTQIGNRSFHLHVIAKAIKE